MGYWTANQRYADTQDLVLAPSAARTTTPGTGSSFELGDRGVLRLTLKATAKTGTSPTLDVTVETSETGATDTWRSLGTFTQLTDTGEERKSFAGADRFVRATWTIGGSNTPGYTFAITGEAV